MEKRIIELPEMGIIKTMMAVEEAVRAGYEVDYKNLRLELHSMSMDITIPFVEDESKKETEESGESAEEVVEVAEEATAALKETEEDETLATEAAIELVNSKDKHAELKEVAAQLGLEVKKNLRNPKSLKKDLLKQLGEGDE